jgi:hypothetical protein
MARIQSTVVSGALLSLVGTAVGASEVATTWRRFDDVRYRAGCHDREAAVRAAQSGPTMGSVWLRLSRDGRCFLMRQAARAQLLEWVAGPYAVLGGEGEQASIWRVRDEFGDEEFILLIDVGGPHEAALSA